MSSFSGLSDDDFWRRIDRMLAPIPHEGNRQTLRRYLKERLANGIKTSTLGCDANAVRGLCLHLGERSFESFEKDATHFLPRHIRHDMPRVIVITGASSGMGRGTALALAERGDNLVLAARRKDALDELARECEARGGRALAIPADVTDEHQLQELSQSAIGEFGHYDAWINTAAVQSFGKYWDVPTRTMRRVVDVVLIGSMLVSKTALHHFLERRAGTLILVSSILSKTPSAYLNVYNAAKHGVAGLATSLRTDLKMEGLDDKIHVVNLMPPSTDTPFFVHAANYTGRVPRPPEPAYSVETLADAIVKALHEPQNEIVVGTMAKIMRAGHAIAPGAYEDIAASMTKGMFTDEPEPRTDGNLFEPMPSTTAKREGGWKEGHPLKKKEVAPRRAPLTKCAECECTVHDGRRVVVCADVATCCCTHVPVAEPRRA